MLAIAWRRLFLAAFVLNLVVVAVLRYSVGTSYIVAVLRDIFIICPICPDCCEVERSVLTTINEDVMLCYVVLQTPLV